MRAKSPGDGTVNNGSFSFGTDSESLSKSPAAQEFRELYRDAYEVYATNNASSSAQPFSFEPPMSKSTALETLPFERCKYDIENQEYKDSRVYYLHYVDWSPGSNPKDGPCFTVRIPFQAGSACGNEMQEGWINYHSGRPGFGRWYPIRDVMKDPLLTREERGMFVARFPFLEKPPRQSSEAKPDISRLSDCKW